MLKKSTAVPLTSTPTITATPGVSSADRATWSEQADRLARNYARAEAAQWGPVAGAVVLVVGIAVYLLADVDFLALAFGVFAVLLAVAVGLAVRVSRVYSSELRLATRATERATWGKEEDLGMDLTGDGFIRDPFRVIKVPRKGGGIEEITFSHPPASRRGEPVMEGWGVSKSDLVAMLYEAEMSRGLQERAWVGDGVERFVMPSGKQVTQSIFRGVLAALAEHDMASKPDGKWRLDVEADDVAASLAKQP